MLYLYFFYFIVDFIVDSVHLYCFIVFPSFIVLFYFEYPSCTVYLIATLFVGIVVFITNTCIWYCIPADLFVSTATRRTFWCNPRRFRRIVVDIIPLPFIVVVFVPIRWQFCGVTRMVFFFQRSCCCCFFCFRSFHRVAVRGITFTSCRRTATR